MWAPYRKTKISSRSLLLKQKRQLDVSFERSTRSTGRILPLFFVSPIVGDLIYGPGNDLVFRSTILKVLTQSPSHFSLFSAW